MDEDHYPLIGRLAVHYRTITGAQLDQAIQIQGKNGIGKDQKISIEDIIIQHKMASSRQVGLLILIRDFIELRQKSESFGKVAIKRGLVTPDDIETALIRQEKEFKRKKVNLLIGDILVDDGILSKHQCDLILKEVSGEKVGSREFADVLNQSPGKEGLQLDDGMDLSEFEIKFLSIKELDKKFGETVARKGFASENDVRRAFDRQEGLFRNHHIIKHIDEILFNQGLLSADQCLEIYNELKWPVDRMAISGNLHGRQTEKMDRPAKLTDADLDLYISPDNLSAYIRIISKNFHTITSLGLRHFLKEKSIVFGVISDNEIKTFLKNPANKQICIAKGKAAKPGQKDEIEYYFNTGFPLKYIGENKNKADNQDIVVPRGKILAKRTPGQESIPGVDIFGNPLRISMKDDKSWRCGEGARYSSDGLKIIAKNEGMPRLSIDGRIYVFSKMNIMDDADIRTGHLGMNNNIAVMGTLKGAFPVRGGDLTADEIRDADVDVIGDVRVTIGITTSRIATQGAVYARYIMNSDIEAYGDIVVENEIIDSTIKTSGALIVKKSRIIASRIIARKGIIAAAIGSPVTNPCILEVGSDAHINGVIERIDGNIKTRLDDLLQKESALLKIKKKEEKVNQKMVKLKKDIEQAALLKSVMIEKSGEAGREKLNRASVSIHDVDRKMKKLIGTLKKLDQGLKFLRKEKEDLQLDLNSRRVVFENEIDELNQNKYFIKKWAHLEKGKPVVKVKGKITQETFIAGRHSTFTLEKEYNNIGIIEHLASDNGMDSWLFKSLSR